MDELLINPALPADLPWIREVVAGWGADYIVSRGVVHFPCELPHLIARRGDVPVGLLTYRLDKDCEVVLLEALCAGQGIGTALMAAVEQIAAAAGASRVWLVTTNDNLDALRFYQRRGYRLAALHAGAIDSLSRPLKPAIPHIGLFGIPLSDELELERRL